MNNETVQKAAIQFGKGIAKIESLGQGLIHRTYKITHEDEYSLVLQCLNQNTFPQPQNVIENYLLIQEHLRQCHPGYLAVPALAFTLDGKPYWIDEFGNFWRATEYINGTYTPTHSRNELEAFEASQCFARFIQQLSGMDLQKLHIVLPGFHDLQLRYQQFENAIAKAGLKRLMQSTHIIAELRERKFYLDFYNAMLQNPLFKKRIMHHDCKMSNILFDEATQAPLCPVDLDTTMPGYFYSDIGDLVRTMSTAEDENSREWEKISIATSLYNALIDGYRRGMEGELSNQEEYFIHHSGLLMTYMQAMRFLTDFLNNDIYYKTDYADHNLNRSLNQLIVLEKLEELLRNEFNYQVEALPEK